MIGVVGPVATTAASAQQTSGAPGYWEVASDGAIFAFDAPFEGSMGGTPLNKPVVAMAAAPDDSYWEVASDGGIFAFGDAGFFGSMGGTPLNQPVVGIAATPDGKGYWEVASDGGIFAFGDAGFYGSMGGTPLNQPVVGMAATPDGQGYWEVASDGGIFAFGDAGFFGSMGGTHLNKPVVAMAATQDGKGYWLVASDGGIFAFGEAGFFGSMGGTHLNKPVVAMAATQDGKGYWLTASDGGIFAFGDGGFFGSMGGTPLNAPIVAMAASLPSPAGPNGYTTEPQNVTSTSADLHATVSCDGSNASNPCVIWFQYWPDGGSILRTPTVTYGKSTNGFLDIHQTVTGLNPGTLYHYQVCGYGDTVNPPGACVSPEYTGSADASTSPGTKPASGDLSATDNFRAGTSTITPTIDLDRVLSTADTKSNPISRDAGVSAPYALGKDIWVFGDTSQVNGPAFLPLGTAAEGSYATSNAPDSLQEVPPGSSPSPFFAEPTGLEIPNQSPPQPCGLPSAWVTGAANVPGTSSVLLQYMQVCNGANFTAERLSLVTYNPSTSTFGTIYTPFAGSPLYSGLPPVETLGSPVYGNDGYLYFFTNSRDLTNPASFFDSGLYLARVPSSPASDMGTPSDYQWWSQPPGQGVGWNSVTDAGYSVSVTPGNGANFALSVADYSSFTSKHFAVLEQTGLGTSTTFQVYEATSPTGPWTLGPAAQIPDACVGTLFPCRGIIGHPELSTSNNLVFSWYSGDDEYGLGHVRVGSIAW